MEFLGPGTQNCVCCSFRTIERKQFRPGVNSNCFQTTRVGLKCGICNRLMCRNCVDSLAISLKTKCGEIHKEFIAFYNSIMEFSLRGSLGSPADYIGHCCLIHIRCEKGRVLKSLLQKKRSIDEKMTSTLFGGSLCLPEFLLLIANNTNCMDVFALGRDTNIMARYHFVVMRNVQIP